MATKHKIDDHEERGCVRQYLFSGTQYLRVALSCALKHTGPNRRHVVYVITCMGNYFPNGIRINDQPEQSNTIPENEIYLIDNFRCYTLGVDRDIQICIQDGKSGQIKKGLVTFFHILHEFAPDEKNGYDNPKPNFSFAPSGMDCGVQ